MVKIKGYDRYYFDPQTGGVFSRKKSGFIPLTPVIEDGKKSFWLYQHSNKRKVSLFEILRENMRGIETFVTGDSKLRDELKMVS